MRSEIITDRTTWDSALCQLPHPQTLQSWNWGAFKSRWGWQTTRLLWQTEGGTPLAAAQILRRAIPTTPWSMLYLPRGPLLNYDNLTLLATILQALEVYGRQQNALFIKIDPDVPLAFTPNEAATSYVGRAVKSLLLKRGWLHAPQQIQFKNTVILDLAPPEETLLAAMKSKWRYNIRLAKRKGVIVRPGGLADLDTFYAMYHLTSQRDGFLIRPKAYYVDVWQTYLKSGQASMLLATVNDTPIAGLILFCFHQTAWYMYGASTNEFRQLMPNHLLQWTAIQVAKAAGCNTYDMWGAPDDFVATDPMWGVYRFKLGFNGQIQRGLGAYDFPLHPLKYAFYNQALPRLLRLLRGTRG